MTGLDASIFGDQAQTDEKTGFLEAYVDQSIRLGEDNRFNHLRRTIITVRHISLLFKVSSYRPSAPKTPRAKVTFETWAYSLFLP